MRHLLIKLLLRVPSCCCATAPEISSIVATAVVEVVAVAVVVMETHSQMCRIVTLHMNLMAQM